MAWDPSGQRLQTIGILERLWAPCNVKGISAVIGPLTAAELYHPEQATMRSTYSGYGFRDVTLFVGSRMVATAAGRVATKLAKRVI